MLPSFPADPVELGNRVLAALSRLALRQFASRPDPSATPEAIPTPLTAFFGRERDIESLTELLRQKARFVTVRTPGGYGKTRLVLETVRRLGDSSRTIAFVDLAEAQTVIELATCVATTMGLNLDRLSQEAPVQLVARVLQGMSGVLILDNFEQLPTEARQTVEDWANRASGVQFLITSRVALARTAERVLDLGTFPVPEPGDATDPKKVAANPALQLFADRVRAFRADFTLTAEAARSAIAICRRVECQPLLIEIMASQLRSRSLSTVVEDLEDKAWLESIESAQSSFGIDR